ncbi:MAG: class I SAM-dependent methyltransferase [Acidobacteria bacterium]|nr:class I SAM-dependent methyltransferase [Acidobacteriota bacterium]
MSAQPPAPAGSQQNVDRATVDGFGQEWSHFTQAGLSDEERARVFNEYFHIFPWEQVSSSASVGADVGCGSGRWAALVAPRVGRLHVIDASPDALAVARTNLTDHSNVSFHLASVDDLPFEDGTLDFAYSLGVLHHVPDTAAALAAVARKLKPGAPLLVYLYYAFDNRPVWFRMVWRASDAVRRVVARLPWPLRLTVSQVLAVVVYWPLARTARLLEACGVTPDSWPLSYYRDKSFYVMRTDALDRFGTRLEQRFTRQQILRMLAAAGIEGVRFSEKTPFWCAVGTRQRP